MQQTGTKGVKEQVWLSWEGDPLGIVQVTNIWQHRQMVCALVSVMENEMHKIFWDF